VLATPTVTPHERALVELSQWLARTLQYAPDHPACRDLAQKALAAVTQSLAESGPLAVGAVKDDTLVDGVSSRHPAIRTRFGPAMHVRGIMVLRLLEGVTLEELTSLVDILSLPAQTVFDRGGVQRLAMEAGLARVQIEELAHDVTAEEREAQRRRAKLRSFFKEVLLGLLARHDVDARIAEHIVELLEHPDIAVAILEAEPAGIAEAASGLALMVRQEEQRSGLDLQDKLRTVLSMLSPRSRDRLLLAFPALVDEFRAAMRVAFDGFSEREVASMVAPSVRAQAAELDVALYALAAAVPHSGKRLSALRWVGLSFFDWPSDDAPGGEALAAIAQPVGEYHSFYSERVVLHSAAHQAIVARTDLVDLGPPMSSWPPDANAAQPTLPAFDGRRSVTDVILIATRTRSFDRFCETLPAAADANVADGSTSAVIGILRGLAAATGPEQREHATATLGRVANSAAPRLLADLEAESVKLEGTALEELAFVVRLLAAAAPAVVLERLDASDNRKMRRILLEALPQSGRALLTLVRPRLLSEKWFVVRNAVVLLARIGADASHLEVPARHPDERVRLEVVRALRAMQLDEAGSTLVVHLLSDDSAEVRKNACLLLRGELLGAGAISELQRFIADDAQPEEIRTAGVDALSRSSRDEAGQALFELLHPAGLIESGAASHVRDLAAVALRRSRAPVAQELFSRGLASSIRRVRRACERASGVAS
jgi:hypothetical protein